MKTTGSENTKHKYKRIRTFGAQADHNNFISHENMIDGEWWVA